MVEHFADCVRTGQPPRYGPAEAACNMTVIEALYRSARWRSPRPRAHLLIDLQDIEMRHCHV